MKKVDIKKLREEAAIMMSCKASIKANRHLRNDEIQALLDDLRKASDPSLARTEDQLLFITPPTRWRRCLNG